MAFMLAPLAAIGSWVGSTALPAIGSATGLSGLGGAGSSLIANAAAAPATGAAVGSSALGGLGSAAAGATTLSQLKNIVDIGSKIGGLIGTGSSTGGTTSSNSTSAAPLSALPSEDFVPTASAAKTGQSSQYTPTALRLSDLLKG